MKRISEALTIELLDVSPTFEKYNPDQILAAAALSTFKLQKASEILNTIPEKTVSKIHKEATRRGHASIATLPTIDIIFDGSRVLDYYLTSLKFTRALMLSSRRVKWSKEDILIPDEISSTSFDVDYENILYKQFDFYTEAIEKGIPLEQARKCLGLGFRSHGLLRVSIDTATELAKMEEDPYIPNEVYHVGKIFGMILKEKAKEFYENKLKLRISTLYPFPNLFNNPFYSPDYSQFLGKPEILNIFVDSSFWDLKEKLEFQSEKYFSDLSNFSRGKIIVRYAKPMSVAVFNEEKRHGSIDMEVESIHFAAKRALKELESLSENLKSVYVPEQFKKEKISKEYLKIVKDSLSLYEAMVENKINPGEAIYVVPQGIKVVVLGNLNGYHLFHPLGYLGVRACNTAEQEMRETTEQLIMELEKVEPRFSNLIGPKCKIGYCLEKNYCGRIFKYAPDYSLEEHKKVYED
jgi:thymidylate synthase ThyX